MFIIILTKRVNYNYEYHSRPDDQHEQKPKTIETGRQFGRQPIADIERCSMQCGVAKSAIKAALTDLLGKHPMQLSGDPEVTFKTLMVEMRSDLLEDPAALLDRQERERAKRDLQLHKILNITRSYIVLVMNAFEDADMDAYLNEANAELDAIMSPLKGQIYDPEALRDERIERHREHFNAAVRANDGSVGIPEKEAEQDQGERER